MGVYVYTMRAKTANIEIDGTTVKANLLSYAFKPYYTMGLHPVQQRMLTRAATFWANKHTPYVFVIGDKFENGCEVRKHWPAGKSSCYDNEWPGEHVGFLKKSGRKWKVVQRESNCYEAD